MVPYLDIYVGKLHNGLFSDVIIVRTFKITLKFFDTIINGMIITISPLQKNKDYSKEKQFTINCI